MYSMINVKAGQPIARTTPPGLRGYPLFGILPQVIKKPLETLTRAARQSGGVVCLGSFLPGKRVILVSHPDPLKRMLLDRASSYAVANAFVGGRMRLMFGKSIIYLTGDRWLGRRRLLQPAFHHDRLTDYASTITNDTIALIEQWRMPADRGETLDIAEEMSKLVSKIFIKLMFGFGLSDDLEETNELVKALKYIDEFSCVLNPADLLPLWTPRPSNKAFKQSLRTFDQLADRLISDRRRNGGEHYDMLSMLLKARDQETGEQLGDEELRDELRTQFTAGIKTTAITLAWVWSLISQHPEVERRFHSEVENVICGRAPSIVDIPRLAYTKMIVQESMRLYPAVWLNPRALQPNEEDVLGGQLINDKTLLLYSPYVTHRLPELWENPDVFDPERFTPERAAKRPQFSYLPFSNGPRQCIANHLALLEITLILASISQQYSLRLAPGVRVEPEPATLLRPCVGVPMTLHHRQ
jgi:cytochrome P450